MFCNGCEREIVEVDGEWKHAPNGYYGYNPKSHKVKPVEITKADIAVKDLILANAQPRNGAWIATLPEKTSKTALKKWVKLGKIAVRTVTYANWTSHVQKSWKLDWGTPPNKNQYEILLIVSNDDNPSAWEIA